MTSKSEPVRRRRAAAPVDLAGVSADRGLRGAAPPTGALEAAPGTTSTYAGIVRAARALFLERGIEPVSMEMLAAEAKVARRTVYNHFEGKQALVEAVVEQLWSDLDGARLREIEAETDVERGLRRLGEALALHWERSDDVRFKRLLIAEAPRFPWLNAQRVPASTTAALGRLAGWIGRHAAAGRLRCEKPAAAGAQFLSLLMGQLFWPRVEGIREEDLSPASDVIDDAVVVFLAAYGPRR